MSSEAFLKDLEAVFAKYGVNVAPHLMQQIQQLEVVEPGRHDTPDDRGLVHLLDILPDRPQAQKLFCTTEVFNSLAPDDPRRAFMAANLSHANSEWLASGHMMTVCYETSANGVDTSKPISGTIALPPQMSIAAIVATYNAPLPEGAGGSFSPYRP